MSPGYPDSLGLFCLDLEGGLGFTVGGTGRGAPGADCLARAEVEGISCPTLRSPPRLRSLVDSLAECDWDWIGLWPGVYCCCN